VESRDISLSIVELVEAALKMCHKIIKDLDEAILRTPLTFSSRVFVKKARNEALYLVNIIEYMRAKLDSQEIEK